MTTRNMVKFFVLFVLVMAMATPAFAGNGNGNQPPRPDNRGNEDPCVEQGNCGNGDHGRGRPKCNDNPNSWRGEPDACPTAQPTEQPGATVTPVPTEKPNTGTPPVVTPDPTQDSGTETPQPEGTPTPDTPVVDEWTQPSPEQPEAPAQQPVENGAPAPVQVAATAAPVVTEVQPYTFACYGEELVLSVVKNSQGDFALSYLVNEGVLDAPINITQQLEAAFGGPIEIGEGFYDPINCKAAVSVRLMGSEGNFQMVLVPAYAVSDWYHVVTNPSENVRLVGFANNWNVFAAVNGQLVQMNQWGRDRREFNVQIEGEAILHPFGEDVFFSNGNGLVRFNVNSLETVIVVEELVNATNVRPVAFNATGSELFYGYVTNANNWVFSTSLVETSFDYVGRNVLDLAVDEDGSNVGVYSNLGNQMDFFGIEMISEGTSHEVNTPASIVVSFDWSDPQDRVTPVELD